jgi:L-ascorbate metabolism protein UlaG (beta-lactamase superfamily)
MLEPRKPWTCTTEGCCVFMGGTAEFDIYMANCHKKPYDPHVLLVPVDGVMYTEFNSVGHFEREMADPESQLLHQHRDKQSALHAASNPPPP